MVDPRLKLLSLALIPCAALLGVAWAMWLPGVLRALGLERRNFRGEVVCTAGGLMLLLIALFGLRVDSPPRYLALHLAILSFGALGFLDDRWGSSEFKGLRGHFGALRRGRITTGMVKAVGGGGVALALGLWLQPSPVGVLTGGLIALSANLFNLLDLRPLRALKLFWLTSVALLWSSSPLLHALVGVSLPYAYLESRRKVMLGDTGANALGAAIGVSAAVVLPWQAQAAVVALLLAFHAWAERNSLSAWIDARPWAGRLDRWGWSSGESLSPQSPVPSRVQSDGSDGSDKSDCPSAPTGD